MPPRKRKIDEVKDSEEPSEGAYKCHICGQAFYRGCGLASHLRRHQPVNFDCEHCGYSCKHKYAYDRHLAISHADIVQSGPLVQISENDLEDPEETMIESTPVVEPETKRRRRTIQYFEIPSDYIEEKRTSKRRRVLSPDYIPSSSSAKSGARSGPKTRAKAQAKPSAKASTMSAEEAAAKIKFKDLSPLAFMILRRMILNPQMTVPTKGLSPGEALVVQRLSVEPQVIASVYGTKSRNSRKATPTVAPSTVAPSTVAPPSPASTLTNKWIRMPVVPATSDQKEYVCPMCTYTAESPQRVAFHLMDHRKDIILLASKREPSNELQLKWGFYRTESKEYKRWKFHGNPRITLQKRAFMHWHMEQNFGHSFYRSKSSKLRNKKLRLRECGRTNSNILVEIGGLTKNFIRKTCIMRSGLQFGQRVIYEGANYYICKECPYTTWSASSLWKHFRHHFVRTTTATKCTVCSFSSCDEKQIELHKKLHKADPFDNEEEFREWLSEEYKVNNVDLDTPAGRKLSESFKIAPVKRIKRKAARVAIKPKRSSTIAHQVPEIPAEEFEVAWKATPEKRAPEKEAPEKETPAKEVPEEETPEEETPEEETPKEETPNLPEAVSTSPKEILILPKTTPLKATPTPSNTTPLKTTPLKTTPLKTTPSKTASAPPSATPTPSKAIPTTTETTPSKAVPAPPNATPTTPKAVPTPAETTPTKATPTSLKKSSTPPEKIPTPVKENSPEATPPPSKADPTVPKLPPAPPALIIPEEDEQKEYRRPQRSTRMKTIVEEPVKKVKFASPPVPILLRPSRRVNDTKKVEPSPVITHTAINPRATRQRKNAAKKYNTKRAGGIARKCEDRHFVLPENSIFNMDGDGRKRSSSSTKDDSPPYLEPEEEFEDIEGTAPSSSTSQSTEASPEPYEQPPVLIEVTAEEMEIVEGEEIVAHEIEAYEPSSVAEVIEPIAFSKVVVESNPCDAVVIEPAPTFGRGAKRNSRAKEPSPSAGDLVESTSNRRKTNQPSSLLTRGRRAASRTAEKEKSNSVEPKTPTVNTDDEPSTSSAPPREKSSSESRESSMTPKPPVAGYAKLETSCQIPQERHHLNASQLYRHAVQEYHTRPDRTQMPIANIKYHKVLHPLAQAQVGRNNPMEYFLRELEIERSRECVDCPYKHRDLKKFRIHRDRHYNGSARHKCKECNYASANPHQVQEHMFVDHYLNDYRNLEGLPSSESEDEEVPPPPPPIVQPPKERKRKGRRRRANW